MTQGLDASTRRRLAVPAALFLLYVVYLAVASPKSFLERWIEGCFAFFLALVLAFVILKNSPAGGAGAGPGDDRPGDGGGADGAQE